MGVGEPLVRVGPLGDAARALLGPPRLAPVSVRTSVLHVVVLRPKRVAEAVVVAARPLGVRPRPDAPGAPSAVQSLLCPGPACGVGRGRRPTPFRLRPQTCHRVEAPSVLGRGSPQTSESGNI